MEEQKKEKVVKMGVVKGTDNTQPQKLTYEQLNQACMEMSQQLQNQNKYVQQLRNQLQQMDYALQSRRIDYLFKVVNLYAEHQLFDSIFVNNCIEEIEDSLTIQEQSEETKEE